MQQRRKVDAEAVRRLQGHWKSIVGKEQVFRGNTMRRGNCQVVMNGTPLLDLCDSRLREAHTHVHFALAACGKRVFGAGSRSPLAIGSVGSSTESKFTPYKRASRGALSKGPARSAGRLELGKEKCLMHTDSD